MQDPTEEETIEFITDLPIAEETAEVTKAGEGRTRLVVGDDQGVFVR